MKTDLSFKNNNLYLLNNNSKFIKLASNIYTYDYIKNDIYNIDICYIDYKNRLSYISYKYDCFKKKSICKLVCNKKNIKNIKFKLQDNLINIFILEFNFDNTYTLVHIHYNLLLNKYYKFEFKNLLYDYFSFYTQFDNLDILCVKFIDINHIENIFYFDLDSISWNNYNYHILSYRLNDYCKNLKYK